MISDIINNYLNIKEAFELSPKLMEIMKEKRKREELFQLVIDEGIDLTKDTISDYFQSYQGDRVNLKQDFTPDSLCELLNSLKRNGCTCYSDVCSGTGSLSIKIISDNPESSYFFEELSKNTIPLLLFNLAIRNIGAVVKNKDTLTEEIFETYILKKSEKYSSIEFGKEYIGGDLSDVVVMNPPYSIKWEPFQDIRFNTFGLAPKGKADYAFVLDGLSRLKDDGELYAILPHGVLFRSGAEQTIRKSLFEYNLVDAIIGLPPKMFMNTAIPTLIFKIKKNKDSKNVLFIDASSEYKEVGKNNILEKEHIEKIVKTVLKRETIEKYSRVVDLEEIKKNDYNLNIPRYVDTFVKEEVPDIIETLKEYVEIESEIKKIEIELLNMMKEITGTSPEEEEKHREAVSLFERIVYGEY